MMWHLDDFEFDLPANSTVYADKAYTHYLVEDCLAGWADQPNSHFRKRTPKRPVPAWVAFLRINKIVETAASLVERHLPKHIHATKLRFGLS